MALKPRSRPTAEQEVLLHLAGTRERRLRQRSRVSELVSSLDAQRLIAAASRQRFLPLAAHRLRELVGDATPAQVEDAAAEVLTESRRQATLLAGVTQQLLEALEQAEVRAVPLKGPFFAERAFGDEGLRASSDVDLLVAPDQFHRAVEAIVEEGYTAEPGAPWTSGLPLFEASLFPTRTWLPPVDLHWRLEWYSEAYSQAALERSIRDAGAGWRLAPADELAALLIYFLRDGFWGLRLGADVAAWWDAFGSAVEPRALDAVIAEDPALRAPLTASAVALESLVGVPAGELMTLDEPVPGRYRWAARRAHWTVEGSDWDLYSAVLMADAVVSVKGGVRSFVRRHWLLPRPVVAEMYGLPPNARVRLGLRSLWYAGVLAKNLARVAWARRRRATGGRTRLRPTGAAAGEAAAPAAHRGRTA